MSVTREGVMREDDGTVHIYGLASTDSPPADVVHVDGKLVPFGSLVRPDGSLVARWA